MTPIEEATLRTRRTISIELLQLKAATKNKGDASRLSHILKVLMNYSGYCR